MTRRGNPEDFVFDPEAPGFDEQSLRSGKGLVGGDPRQRTRRGGHSHAPLDQALLQVADLADPRYQARLADFLARGPLEIEIGFGDGVFLLDRVCSHPQTRFLGFEVRWQLLRPVLDTIEAESLANVWVCGDDARYALARSLPAACAEVIHILLPDPWWKRRHLSKRIVSPFTVDLFARALAPGGLLHVKTDVWGYATLIEQLVLAQGAFAAHDPALATRLAGSVPTTREAWCKEHGFPVFTYYFRKRGGRPRA